MKPITQLILILLLTFMVVPTNADAITTGGALLTYCENGERERDPSYIELGFCRGYISGASWTMFYTDTQNNLCLPKNNAKVTNNQLKRIVVKYLKENPQRLHEEFMPLILSALEEAFSCKSDFPE
jgi:hypothetical protein